MTSKRVSWFSVLVILVISLSLLFTFTSCSSSPSTTTVPQTTSAAPKTSAQVPTVPAAAKTVEFKFANEMPPESSMMKELWQPWADDINKATNGRVKITLYPGESLGASNTYIEAIKSGMIDIAWDSLEYFEGRFDNSMVGYYPMGAKVTGTTSLAWWDLYKQFPEIQNEFSGMKVLALDGSPSYQVFVSKKSSKDVTTLADMKGLKLKAGGGTLNDAVSALGGSPVTIPAPQQYDAISKGTIDGSWFVVADGLMFNLQDVCRSVTIVNGPPCGFFTVMSPDSYNKMSPEDQKIFDSLTGQALVARTAKLRYQWEQTALGTMSSKGVKIINPSADEYAKFQAALQTMVDPWEKKMDAAGKPGTKIYNAAKDLVTKYDNSGWWK